MLGLGLGLPYSAPPNLPILNQLPPASAAYSLRKLISGATRAIRVRDNTGAETDIGFAGQGLDIGNTIVSVPNLLGTLGNFAVDSNSDGVADGWTATNTTANSVSGNVQTFTATAQNAGVEAVISPVSASLYACAYVKTSKTNVALRVAGGVTLGAETLHTGSGAYEFISVEVTGNNTGNIFAKVYDKNTSAWTPTEMKQFYVINRTSTFGAGNEPSKAAMDNFMKSVSAYQTQLSIPSSLNATSGLCGWLNRNLVASVPLGVDGNADGVSDGWVLNNSSSIGTNSIEDNAQKVTTTSMTEAYSSYGVYKEINIVAGNTITLSSLYKLIKGTGTPRVRISLVWYNGLSYLSDNSVSTATESSTFINLSGTFTAPANTTKVRIYLHILSVSGGDTGSAWFKDATVTITNQSAYDTTWYDQSGNNNHATQSTAGNQPRIVNAGVVEVDASGKPTLFFDGVNDVLSIANNSALDITNTALSINHIFTPLSVGVGQYIISRNYSNSAEIQYASLFDGTNLLNNLNLENSNRSGTGSGAIPINSIAMVTHISNVGSQSTYDSGIKGSFVGTYNGSLTSRLYTQIGARCNNTTNTAFAAYYGGDISEITLFNVTLTDTQRQKLERSQGKFYNIAVS